MTPFQTRLSEAIRKRGPLCVGLDPSSASLAKCGLPDSAEGAHAFAQRILTACQGRVAIVKPQAAYFERFGSAGWQVLETIFAQSRTAGIMTLLDVKRGDIDTTGEAYSQAFFTPGQPTFVDAITVHAYLGFGALRRLFDYSVKNGGGVFVVVRSSNPEGEALQQARLANGLTVAQDLARAITEYNQTATAQSLSEQSTPLGPVGAVVGATCADANETVLALPHSYILAPGIGAQGATLSDLLVRMPAAKGRILPSVSRGILAQGTQEKEITQAISELQQQATEVLGY